MGSITCSYPGFAVLQAQMCLLGLRSIREFLCYAYHHYSRSVQFEVRFNYTYYTVTHECLRSTEVEGGEGVRQSHWLQENKTFF